MLKEKINKDYIDAFKAKDSIKKNLLSVVKSTIQSTEKNLMVENLPDNKVTEILNSVSKSLKETISKLEDSTAKESAISELTIIESYLPKQMNEEEISNKIAELKNKGITTMPEIMKAFAGLPVDRKLVAKLI